MTMDGELLALCRVDPETVIVAQTSSDCCNLGKPQDPSFNTDRYLHQASRSSKYLNYNKFQPIGKLNIITCFF